MDDRESDLLAFFECQCQGMKFYDSHDVTLRHGTRLALRRERSNPHDYFCIIAFVSDGRHSRASHRMLGHVAREACRLLCPLLSASTLRVTRSVKPKQSQCKPYVAMISC